MIPVLESSLSTLGLWALIGYLLGSIPFGILLTRALNLGDLRTIGSGNIGATNVLRTGNKAAAAATLVLDGGKGAAAVLLARHFAADDAAQVAALTAFLGHLYPVWLSFRGGKGVATFLGLFIALHWPTGLGLCATWLATAFITRYSSVAALIAAGSTPVWLTFTGGLQFFPLSLIFILLIQHRHSENIKRLKAKTEPKIGQKKPLDPKGINPASGQ